MQADQVLPVLDIFARIGTRAWVAGGWAVDAVVGRQTRPHGDLDLAVDAEQLPDTITALQSAGFVVTVDALPSRLELRASDGRCVDLHPVRFLSDGSGVQDGLGEETFCYSADGFATGTIGAVEVACLSTAQQLAFREGYEPRDVDLHDVRLLRARL
ncbi:MAG TPA: lincomycin resistance protein LmrB [Propionibacteriaceae bacterium]|nr:lincomycin resistance protein LmrB [Propionibacteriaceae bacterium]